MTAVTPAQIEATERRIIAAIDRQGAEFAIAVAKLSSEHSTAMANQSREICAAMHQQRLLVAAQGANFTEALRRQAWMILGAISVIVGIMFTISTVFLELN